VDESFFQALGQPDGRQLERLPAWAAEWVQSLKYDAIEAYHKRHGRHITFPGRRRLKPHEEAECQDKINDLPLWASEWIYTLRFEIWWQGQHAMQNTTRQSTTQQTATQPKAANQATLFD
jgi:hypothetical protein